ncbi:MAG: DUF6125 family protein [Candidatus Helarchaeota archaeon]
MSSELNKLTKERLIGLIVDAAKNWLAHDGLWFQEVEKVYGMDKAIELDANAWRKFTVIEAKRIMQRMNIKHGGGIPSLIEALKYRLYAHINEQEIIEITDNRCIFRMNNCRVQAARKRRGLPDFPCKPVGLVEYSEFAKAIDPRIKTRCIACPPDVHPKNYFCSWEFIIQE